MLLSQRLSSREGIAKRRPGLQLEALKRGQPGEKIFNRLLHRLSILSPLAFASADQRELNASQMNLKSQTLHILEPRLTPLKLLPRHLFRSITLHLPEEAIGTIDPFGDLCSLLRMETLKGSYTKQKLFQGLLYTEQLLIMLWMNPWSKVSLPLGKERQEQLRGRGWLDHLGFLKLL